MSSDRRGFLRQLATLPLVGGGMTLIGQPEAVAEPVTDHLLWSYKDWLFFEHRMLSHELVGPDLEQVRLTERYSMNSCDWHFQWAKPGAQGPAGWYDAPQPSTRAALVLSAVGCSWREVAR